MEQVRLNKLTVFCTLLTCAVAIGTIIYQAGVQTAMLTDHERRITTIENAGSNTLQKHVAKDEQQEKDTIERITKIETTLSTIVTSYGDLKSEFRFCGAKIDAIKEMVSLHIQEGKKP